MHMLYSALIYIFFFYFIKRVLPRDYIWWYISTFICGNSTNELSYLNFLSFLYISIFVVYQNIMEREHWPFENLPASRTEFVLFLVFFFVIVHDIIQYLANSWNYFFRTNEFDYVIISKQYVICIIRLNSSEW